MARVSSFVSPTVLVDRNIDKSTYDNVKKLVEIKSSIVTNAENIQSIIDARQYADNASASADSASTSEANASTSEDNAKTSEDNASALATIATNKADEASTSASNAQLRAWEAEAEKLTATSYAEQPHGEYVKKYTSNNDGTFTATETSEYSALHYATETDATTKADKLQTINTDTVYDDATTDINYKLYVDNGDIVLEEL